jgi:hypothetical protein
MNAIEAAQTNGKVEELHTQLVELANAQNKSTDAGTFIPATFMRVTVSICWEIQMSICAPILRSTLPQDGHGCLRESCNRAGQRKGQRPPRRGRRGGLNPVLWLRPIVGQVTCRMFTMSCILAERAAPALPARRASPCERRYLGARNPPCASIFSIPAGSAQSCKS